MRLQNVFLIAAASLLPLVAASAAETAKRGEVVFQTDFDGPDALSGWHGQGQLTSGSGGGKALLIERAKGSEKGASSFVRTLPVERFRGCRISFSATVKAENLSRPPQSWNGVKFMAPIDAPSGKQWPAASFHESSFDWQKVSFSVRVPEDATKMSLVLGLEQVSGKVWFDDIRVWVMRVPMPPTKFHAAAADTPLYRGHNLPRLRGAMIPTNISADSLRTFGRDWNANLVRWQLTRSNHEVKDPADLNEYMNWLHKALDHMDAMLPVCKDAGLYVVVDLHSPPGGGKTAGGYQAATGGLFNSAECQAKFVDVWRELAKRYKDSEVVWGYDLVNEPVEDSLAEGMSDWSELAERAAKAVRAIDQKHAIIVEPAEWGNPGGFNELRPIDVPNVVYSFHMYLPHTFTHQGVHGQWKPVHYPGVIDGKPWDKAQLEAAMKPAIDFQKKYHVHMFVGEFSAIRWAPDDSGYRYLKDVIDLFESHGWDWTYHAFREWDGWSVEHGSDPKVRTPSLTPTTRQILLKSWYSKNKKPDWK